MATLGGSGPVDGPTTFNAGAHLAPGNSTGTLTFTTGLTLNDGTIFDLELGTTRDLIRVSRALSQGRPLTQFELGTVIGGYSYTFSQVGNQFLLTASAIPEPATFAARAALGALTLSTMIRRHHPK